SEVVGPSPSDGAYESVLPLDRGFVTRRAHNQDLRAVGDGRGRRALGESDLSVPVHPILLEGRHGRVRAGSALSPQRRRQENCNTDPNDASGHTPPPVLVTVATSQRQSSRIPDPARLPVSLRRSAYPVRRSPPAGGWPPPRLRP